MKKTMIGKIAAILLWPFMYIGTKSYETTFVLLAILAVLGVINEYKRYQQTSNNKWNYILAGIASFALVMADYSLFLGRGKLGLPEAGYAFVAGILVWNYIFVLCRYVIGRSYSGEMSLDEKRKVGITGFCLPFIIDTLFLAFVEYPGWIPVDSGEQLREILMKDYANHHPIWHTKYIEMIFRPVYSLTGNGNIAATAFCVFQIFLFSLAFLYVVMTLYEIGINKKVLYALIVIYSIMPQNVIMSCSLVKDSAFALGCMLWTTALFRILNNLQYGRVNYVLYAIATIMCCLFRKNGMIAMFVTFVFLAVICIRHKLKSLCICTLLILLVTVILDRPVVNYWGIEQPDVVESLHIPLQQIARVGVDEKELTDYERSYIEGFCDYEELVNVYNSQNADYVKNYVRYNGNEQFIDDNKMEFIKVWASIGIHHPGNYIKAWVDQTWGFWSSSTFYSTWEGTVSSRVLLEGYGIHAVERDNIVTKIWNVWNGIITRNDVWFVEIILNVGIRFWIICYCVINAIRNKQKDFVIGIMPIMIIATLAIATPLSHEFRYAYGVFTSFPIIFMGLLGQRKQ